VRKAVKGRRLEKEVGRIYVGNTRCLFPRMKEGGTRLNSRLGNAVAGSGLGATYAGSRSRRA